MTNTKQSVDTLFGSDTAVGGPAGAKNLWEKGVRLLVYHLDGAQTVDLVADQPLILGRDQSASLVIRDRSLSRQHVSFELIGKDVWVEDLQSTNGTLLNGKPIEKSLMKAGDGVTVGSVSITLSPILPAEHALEGLAGHDRFIERMREEVIRHRFFGRPLSLAIIRLNAPQQTSLAQWYPQLESQLRPVDKPGLYSSNTIELLLPELDSDNAATFVREFLEKEDALVLQVGIAAYPQSAATADELLQRARIALREATPDSPLQRATSRGRGYEVKLDSDRPLIVESSAMKEVFGLVDRVARSMIPVLITGATGSGKEVIAQEIHARGKRKDHPLRCLNCGALPQQLVESALFGYERGAFTGADKQTKGIFEEAEGGTVFLDEVGELSLAAQVALLRSLETRCITRVGSSKEIAVDVRIVAATNRPLQQMCDEGTFRLDLLYRLNAMTIELPSLSERVAEIEPLARLFLRQAAESNEMEVTDIGPEALDLMRRYRWPGNVRELRNAMERAVVIARGPIVCADDLPRVMREKKPVADDAEGFDSAIEVTVDEGTGFKDMMASYEAQVLLDALRQEDWNQTRAAKLLQMPLRTFAHKMKLHGIKKQVGYDLE